MGKIRKHFTQEKHGATLSSYISEFIRTAESLPLYKLRSHLASFPSKWPFPRGDIYHWITLLNRFDEVFEQFIGIYALDKGAQSSPFGRQLLLANKPEPTQPGSSSHQGPDDNILNGADYAADGDQELVEAIISFTRILHENCGNRSLYASSGRLSHILNTTSSSLQQVTLRLMHRLAQRYTAQRMRHGQTPFLGGLRPELLSVHFAVDLQKLQALGQVIVETTETSNGGVNSQDEQPTLTPTRLLAIACLAQVYPESILVDKVLKPYADKPRHQQFPQVLCELIRPPSSRVPKVSRPLQTLALLTLESLTCHKNLGSEVCTALNVSVNHGPLASALRQAVNLTIDDGGDDFSEEDADWLRELFELSRTLPKTSPRAVEGLISAGLIDMLVEILKAKSVKAEKMHEPAMQFMSSYAWMVPDALTSLVNIGGLDVMSELLVHHIARAISLTKEGKGLSAEHRTQATDYQIPFHQQQSLRTIFKFIHNMLSASTGFDRLMRNLLEGSDVLASLRTVIGNSKVFGSNVWTNCVHVFSTFINNEPTSFTAIAEAGIPRAILESIVLRPLNENSSQESASSDEAMQDVTATSHIMPDDSSKPSTGPAGGILPALEAVNAVPDAFGAMCLNEAGFQQLEKSGALEVLFGVFSSPAHVKAFSNAAGPDLDKLGSSIEQLHRHNPSLAVKIKDLVSSTATRLAKLVSTADASGLIPNEPRERTLEPNGPTNAGSPEDVDMNEAQPSPEPPKSSPTSGALSTPASTYVGVYTKFLSSIFGRNNTFSAHFTEKGGLDSLLAMAGAPGLFKESLSPAQKFAEVIRSMVEQKPHLMLPPLIARIQEHLDNLSPLLEHSSETSYMLPLANASQGGQLQWSEIMDREARLQSLVHIQLLVPSLTKGLTPPHSSHPGRHAPLMPLTQVNVSDMLCPLIKSLGRLQCKILWEQQLCAQARKNDRQTRTMNGQSQGPRPSTTNPSQPSNAQAQSDPLSTTLPSDPTHRSGKVDDIFTSIASIASKYLYAIPGPITELFFKISNTMVPRRLAAESFQRQQVFKMGDQIGHALIELLVFNFPPDTPTSTVLAFRKATYDCIKNSLSSQRDFGPRAGSQLQLIVIKAFLNKGCIGKVGQIIRDAMEINVRPKADDELESLHKQIHDESTSVMTNFLSLLTTIGSFASLSQGPHLDTLRSRERPELVGREYITASQLSVEIRSEITRAILPIWTSLEPELVDSSVIKNMSKVIEDVLDVTGDVEAFRRGSRHPKSASNTSKTWTPRNSQLASLEESAYSRDLAVEALYRCNDSEALAREYCSYFHDSDTRTRHPPPDQDVHLTSIPADSDQAQTPAALAMPQIDSVPGLGGPNLEWEDSAEDAEMDTSTNAESEGPDSSAPPSNEEPNPPPGMLLNVLSDVANTILQDPTNAAHPAAPEQSSNTAEPNANVSKAETTYHMTTVEDLDERRQEVRASLMDRCLTICGSHDDVTFEMSDLIARSIPPGDEAYTMRAEVSSTLVMSLVSYSEAEDLTPEAKKLSGIAHLLGIILQGPDFFDAAREELQESFSSLVALVRVKPDQTPAEHAPWIPQILLILERVLVEDLQPQHIHFVPPPQDNPLKEQPMIPVPEMMISKEVGTTLFQLVVDLLPRVGKELHLGHALTRVLVVLTRSRHLAKSLSQTSNMHKFLSLVKQLAPVMSERFKSSVLLILRHIVEDDDTIRRLIRSDIREMLEKSPRPVDTTKFCKELYHAALRSPELFVEVTAEMCEVSRFERQPSTNGPQIITLKKTPDTTDAQNRPGAEGNTEEAGNQDGVQPSTENITADEKMDEEAKPRIPEMKPPVVEHPDGVIHLLLIELLNFQNIEDKSPIQSVDRQNPPHSGDVEMAVEQSTSTGPLVPAPPRTSSPAQKEHFKVEEHPIFLYRCFILQALTELLASYNRTKVEFINFSRKADPLAATPSKPRSGILNYLLNALLPTGTIEHPSGIDSKKKSQTSNFAIGAIVALCSRTTENGSTKQRDLTTNEDEPELAFVRKFVLEHALKAYKDCMSSSEPVGAKYSKLLALADLFNRMLAGRPAMHPGYRGRAHTQEDNLEPSNKQIAKIMFEKNFAGALTSSMSDIDPKLVGGNRLIKYILRPLKLLTHTAIELSIAGDPSTSPGTSTDDDEISSASSMSEAGNDREETPDLYRHSTLGMFEPGREEDPSSSESEGEEEEMYEEGYADEMEYEEEEDDPNEGDVVSDVDDDEHMEGVGPVEGLHGDVGIDVEIELDDGDSGSDDDDDEDMGEDDDDEDDDGEDDEEDEDEEILDEITGDNENDSLGDGPDDEELRDDADMDAEGGHATFAEMLAAAETPWTGDDEPSDAELEEYDGTNLDIDAHMPHEHLQHGEEAIDLESAGDEEGESGAQDQNRLDSFADLPDDEEDDYEEEYLYQQDMEDDDEIPPYLNATLNNAHGRRPARPPHFFTSRLDPIGHRAGMFDPDWRDAVTGQPRGTEGNEGQNPLLNRDRRPGQAGSTRNAGLGALQLPSFADIFPRLEDLGAGGTHDPEQYRYLTSLIDALGRSGPGGAAGLLSQLPGGADLGGSGIQIRMGGPGGRQDLMEIAIPALPPHHHHHHHHHHHNLDNPIHSLHSRMHGSASMPQSDPALAVAFQPISTAERWQNEARMVFGGLYASVALKVVPSIHRILIPLAMDADNQRREKLKAEEKKRQEEREKELKEREEKERIEREEREAREAAERAEAEAAAASARETQTTGDGEPAVEAMEGVETAENADETAPQATAPEEAAPAGDRVYTNIRGSQLDITDLGIDAAYLEALPEDMREEVIMGRYTEQRSEAAAAGADASAVDNEFLQALPEDIREEILAQERQERRRRERQEQRRQQAVANGQPTQAEDMDPASFMASLDPVLRQQVLAEADDEMLNSLPAELAAEARALGGHHRRRALDPTRILEEIAGSGPARDRRQTAAEGQRQRRPIVQMLDKASVNTLLRLMFLPVQSNARQTLNGILRNASGNHQSRGEIVSGLLQVLQDGSQDHGAIEKSFSQMTNRAKQSSVAKTPIKKVTSNETPAPSDASPRLVIGNCLASLVFLTQSIPHIPKFFLTEHEIIVGSKLKNKAKGKARDTKAARIPLNALLSLLDRDVVIADALLVEQLAGLLQSVTSPLVQLLKKEKTSASEPTKIDQNTLGQAQPSSTAAPSGAPGQPQQITLPLSTDGAAASIAEDASAQTPTAATGSETEAKPADVKPMAEPKKPFEPPEIPEENLCLIINIMTSRDCNSKSFRDALSTVNNLSSIPGAREVFGQELVTRARQLAKSIMADLSQLTNDFNKASDAMEAQNMALSKFSPSGSDQAKFSRVLTAVDYLFDAKNAQDKTKQNGVAQAGNELLSSLHEDPTFSKVWIELNQTLTAAHNILAQGQQSDKTFLNVATILLPLIESLMVVSKRLDLKDVRSLATSQKISAPDSPAAESSMKQIFFKFTNDHRKILNDLVRQNPKLMSGTFAVLIKNSSVLEFDNKRNYFSRRLHQRTGDARAYPHASLSVNVRRDQVFTDSYRSLFFKKPEEMKYGKLNIRFHNEEGVDAGGVTREWFQVLSRQMFDANFALFNPVAADRTTFHPNPLSYVNEESLPYFQFIGRIIGKALYENRVLDCHFSRAVYKQLLGRQVSLKDMETIDLDYAKSLQWMLDNDITDIITETFSVTSDNFGVIEVIDLQPNGREVPVTDENKHEYVRLVIEHKLTGSVREQLRAFLKGFHDIVPADLIAIFDEGELELLISGLPDIDVSDWKANTDYQNYNASSAQIQWFWRAVRSFGKEERAKLLQFITGTGKVPLNGFKELEGMNGFTHFSIHKDFGSKDRLPSSHTCFNQLDLPEYDSYESLRKNLYTAMTTGGDYFGFA